MNLKPSLYSIKLFYESDFWLKICIGHLFEQKYSYFCIKDYQQLQNNRKIKERI